MKLNYDCLRQTLIALEEHLSISDDYSFQHEGIHQISDYPELSSFDKKEIAYCVYMLADSGMIAIIEPTDIIREIRVETLTYKGHEFI